MRSIRDVLATYDYDSKTGEVTEKQTGKQITDENELLELKTAFYYKYRIDDDEKERRRITNGKTGGKPEDTIKKLKDFYSRQFSRNQGLLKNYTDDFSQCEDLATASLRYNLRRVGKDAKNIQLIVSDGSNDYIKKHGTFMDYVKFDVVDYERVKEGEKKMASKLDKIKSYKPEDYDKGEYLSLTPEESARRRRFVDSLIMAYDTTESPEDYQKRREDHMMDSERVVKAIKENYFAGDRTPDINGFMDYDSNGKQYKFYSSTEIKKMTQMLKTAKIMSEKTGEDYLEAFLNQPSVNQILLTIKQDKNGVLKGIKDQAIQNVKSSNVPKYPEVSCRDYDKIINGHVVEDVEISDDGFMKNGKTILINRGQTEQLEQEEQQEIIKREERNERESIANPENLTQRQNISDENIDEVETVKKSDKFKRGYKSSEARKKLLNNKSRSLNLQQETCMYMVMSEKEKAKKIEQPTKSRGMGR